MKENEIEEFTKVLDTLGVPHREISLRNDSDEKTHIETGMSINASCGIPSKLEIETSMMGGKSLAMKLCRKMILQIYEKVNVLSGILLKIHDERLMFFQGDLVEFEQKYYVCTRNSVFLPAQNYPNENKKVWTEVNKADYPENLYDFFKIAKK